MNAVAVPTLPNALKYMFSPPQGYIRGRTLIIELIRCSYNHGGCESCPCLETCRNYFDFLIDSGAITNWQGAKQNVTRYYK